MELLSQEHVKRENSNRPFTLRQCSRPTTRWRSGCLCQLSFSGFLTVSQFQVGNRELWVQYGRRLCHRGVRQPLALFPESLESRAVSAGQRPPAHMLSLCFHTLVSVWHAAICGYDLFPNSHLEHAQLGRDVIPSSEPETFQVNGMHPGPEEPDVLPTFHRLLMRRTPAAANLVDS